MYSGPFRGLIKSMLRKNPELRPSAADLLRNPYLRPYVLNIHLMTNNPRRQTLPIQQPNSNYVRKTRFLEPQGFKTEKRLSLGNNRALNPSVSGNELESPCSSRRAHNSLTTVNDKFSELSLGSVVGDVGLKKTGVTKFSSAGKTHRLTSVKPSSNTRRLSTPSKISNPGSTRELLPVSHTPARKPSQPTRRASLPLSTRTSVTTGSSPYKPSIGLLGSIQSPDVSVNAPRMDKMVEFPMASSEDPLFPNRRTSSTSAQCSSTSPYSGDRSITKDKCMVQIPHPAQYNGSECSEHNPGSGGGSARSSSDSRQRRFDTSSYQQRAEALEGLLEFSAQLLQQERIDELQVLLKPFGPERVSPRETAIWLSKSFKENGNS